jgi:hypothetical protein
MNETQVVITASQREISKCVHLLYIMLLSEEKRKSHQRGIAMNEDHHHDF